MRAVEGAGRDGHRMGVRGLSLLLGLTPSPCAFLALHVLESTKEKGPVMVAPTPTCECIIPHFRCRLAGLTTTEGRFFHGGSRR